MPGKFPGGHSSRQRGFTLIELLIVIAVIAILAVVVVLVLNPAELLRQSRDSQRLSDMSTLNTALNLYVTDQTGNASFSLGSPSTTYLSTYDPTATSTAGTDCTNLGFYSGGSFHCDESSANRSVNGTGWIPVNFQSISAGSPFGSLPVDPVNQTSSGLYYTYTTTGSQYEIMAVMESTKYRSNVTGSLGNGIDIQGSSQSSGPVGWWPLNEGSGTIAYDASGNGDNGTWHGHASGTNGYYSPGPINQWAGTFDGATTDVFLGTSNNLNVTTGLTILAWIDLTSYQSTGSYGFYNVIVSRGTGALTENNYLLQVVNSSTLAFEKRTSPEDGQLYDSSAVSIPLNTWEQVGVTINNTSGTFYLNGAAAGSFTLNGILSNSGLSMGAALGDAYQLGPATNFPGLIEDARIYNRPLSPQEILAIYNARN